MTFGQRPGGGEDSGGRDTSSVRQVGPVGEQGEKAERLPWPVFLGPLVYRENMGFSFWRVLTRMTWSDFWYLRNEPVPW